MTRRRLLLGLLAGVSLLAVVMLPVGWHRFSASLQPPLAQPVEVDVAKGLSIDQVGVLLEQSGAVSWRWWFVLLVKLEADGMVQAGEYRFEAGDTLSRIIAKMRQGQTIQHRLTIPEGLTVADIARLLELSGWDQAEEIIEQPDLLKQIGTSPRLSLEGILFPDTYFFRRGDTTIDLLKRMVRKGEQILNHEWDSRAVELLPPTLDRYQALIVASMIEKEAKRSDERARIAAVFYNRMKRNMKLQSDPTVLYGHTGFSGPITRQILKSDTPYNTYVNHGLPPTPICNPGQAAIHAALHPEVSDYLYFVARGDGSHSFAKTLAEHQRFVALYQKTSHKNTLELPALPDIPPAAIHQNGADDKN
ncbi:MAG: endolytic transglycosylase MltG [Magnetococcales bacterium]|nr:endolytic transglycosylase MltG [Magnetococcales bacterium]